METAAQTLFYRGRGGSAVSITLTADGIVLQSGYATFYMQPQPFNPHAFRYSTSGLEVTISFDLLNMTLLTADGMCRFYRLSDITGYPQGYVQPFSSPGWNYDCPGSHSRSYILSQIREMKHKIRDARRSLRMYKRMYRHDPSISGMMLIIEQQKLIQTYEDRLQWLESQL